MQRVGTLIRARRLELGETLRALASKVGCSPAYLSTIENNRRTSPPSEQLLERLECALRMQAGTLLHAGSWQSTPDSIRKRVRDLESDQYTARRLAALLKRDGIDALHASGELSRLVGRLVPDEMASGVSLLEALPMRVPLINKVTAGYPADFTDLGYPARIADEYVSVPGIEDPDAFAARVVGDSMTPQYCEGDIVVFSPLSDTASGSDCFVRFDESIGGESTFKRVYFEEDAESRAMIRLQPINPEYPPRSVKREDVAGLYAAVYVVRRVGG